MRKLILLVMLTGAFLGGYYLGRKPDSPDIFSVAKQHYDKAVEVSRKISHFVEGKQACDASAGTTDPNDAEYHPDPDAWRPLTFSNDPPPQLALSEQ